MKACPFCNSTDLVDGSWYVDDEEVPAVECETCKAGAPASVWNNKPSPWRYPERGDPMPDDGQRVLCTYNKSLGIYSDVVIRTHIDGDELLHPIGRWMPIPPA